MEDWSREESENHILVMNSDGQSFLVKISRLTTVDQLLTKACHRWRLSKNNHCFRYHTEELHKGDAFVQDITPNNATLNLMECDKSFTNVDPEHIVPVTLEYNNKTVWNRFHKSETLSQVVCKLYETGIQHRSPSNLIRNDFKQVLMDGSKLLVNLGHGSLAFEFQKLDNTTISDLSHNGHVHMTFLMKDLENEVEKIDNEVLHDEDDDLSRNDDQKECCEEDESEPSCARIKRIVDASSTIVVPSGVCKQQPGCRQFHLAKLLDRYGCLYRTLEPKKSNVSIPKMKIREESGVYSLNWISVKFPDDLVLQAAFLPCEYIEHVKQYIRQYLTHPDSLFQLYAGSKLLDEEQVIFTSGLPQSCGLRFVPLQNEYDIDNTIDTKYYSYLVTPQVAKLIKAKYKERSPGITIESQCYSPRLEEHPQDRLTSRANI